MSKKPGLTITQHDAIGLTLQTMYDNLMSLSGILSSAYPLKDNKAHNFTGEALALIVKVRQELENKAFQQHWTPDHNRLGGADLEEARRKFFQLYGRAGRNDYQKPTEMAALRNDVCAAPDGIPFNRPEGIQHD